MSEIVIDYRPRIQFVPFHQRNKRWSCIVAHRRAGKTVACINDIVARALYTTKKNGRYAYIAPFYRQAKDTAWQYLKDTTGKAASKVSESELSTTLVNKSKITLYGADNPDALRGIYLDGVILDEYGDCRPSLWGKVVLPTLADRKGWAVFIGTPKGNNHFYQIWNRSRQSEDWFHLMLKASVTGILGAEELREMKAQMTDDEYAQEFECSFEAAVQGTFYAKLVNAAYDAGRVTKVEWDPDQPVEVASDLGFSDSTAFWFWQYRPDGIAIIDHEEDNGQPLSYYFDMLHSKPYDYKKIWLPHDARAKTLQTGRSTVEQFLNNDFPVEIAPNLKVQHGIDAGRYIFPMCWFDAEKCYTGLEALKAYRRKYDEVTKTFGKAPQHDWSSNSADAFRYMALVTKEHLSRLPDEVIKQQYWVKPPEYQLEPMFKEREREILRVGRRGRIR